MEDMWDIFLPQSLPQFLPQSRKPHGGIAPPCGGKDQTMRKDARVTVRFAGDDWAAVKDRAAKQNMPIARYIRALVFTAQGDIPAYDWSLLSSLLVQTKRIGTNLNQITRRINKKGADPALQHEPMGCLAEVDSVAKDISSAMAAARKPL